MDDAPVLCHQPLDYLTAQVVWKRLTVPAMTNKFGQFSDRWVVAIGTLFGKVLDPRQHIKKIWKISIPEGLREVLWKEMNDAQVLGRRYFSTRYKKSDMGRICPCGQTMFLAHILLGCPSYELWPLLDILLKSIWEVGPKTEFRTLQLDEWGYSPWYPLLVLQTIEELALPIFKG